MEINLPEVPDYGHTIYEGKEKIEEEEESIAPCVLELTTSGSTGVCSTAVLQPIALMRETWKTFPTPRLTPVKGLAGLPLIRTDGPNR